METLQRTANRGSISTGGYEIDNSLKLESDNSERMQKLYGAGYSETSDLKYTYSGWVKRTEIGAESFIFNGGAGGTQSYITFTAGDALQIYATGYRLDTNRLFRDSSAWYHIVVAFDSTQGTASDRLKLYVNGVQETSFSTSTYPTSSSSSYFYTVNMSHYIAQESGRSNGYYAEVHWIDGQQLAPTEFGEFDDDSGIWKPKEYNGTYGNEGFYLDFKDSSALGADVSGNSNNFTALYNITAADQATDTPTNNFATFNVQHPRATNTTIAEGGTEMYINSNYQTAVSSIAVSKGKWYAEFIPGSHTAFVGFVDVTEWTIPQLHNGFWLGYDGTGNTMSVSMKGTDGTIYNESNSASGATYGNTDVVSVALDMDNRKAYFAVNGTWVNSGNPATEANPILWYTQRADGTPWTDVITMGITGYTNTYHRCNFGGYSSVSISSAASDGNGYGTFEFAPPAGFYALCSQNLALYG